MRTLELEGGRSIWPGAGTDRGMAPMDLGIGLLITLLLTALVGVAVRESGNGTADEMLLRADDATYAAKASGKGRYILTEAVRG